MLNFKILSLITMFRTRISVSRLLHLSRTSAQCLNARVGQKQGKVAALPPSFCTGEESSVCVFFSRSFLTRFEQITKSLKFQVSIRFHHIAHAFYISPLEMSANEEGNWLHVNRNVLWFGWIVLTFGVKKTSRVLQINMRQPQKQQALKSFSEVTEMFVSVYLTSDSSYVPSWWNIYIKATVEAAEVWVQLFLLCGWLTPLFFTSTALITVANISTLAVGVW